MEEDSETAGRLWVCNMRLRSFDYALRLADMSETLPRSQALSTL